MPNFFDRRPATVAQATEVALRERDEAVAARQLAIDQAKANQVLAEQRAVALGQLEADMEQILLDWEKATAAGKRLATLDGVETNVVMGQFAMVQEETQWFRCVLTLLAKQADMETGSAISPNLSNENRHYNAGRVAGLRDFRDSLLQLWMRSQRKTPP